MADNDVTYTRAVQLRYCGFTRQGDGWGRGWRLLTDASLATMDDATWEPLLTRLR